MENEQQKYATKLVEVRLAALTRVEYMEVVEVPANITQDELNALVNERYQNVDGGDFTEDSGYWERGTCYAVDSDMPNATPSMMAFRTEHGLHVERADSDAVERANPDAGDFGKAPNTGYLASVGWGHIFVGNREETTRWIYDCEKENLVCADVFNNNKWVPLESLTLSDLLESIHDNDATGKPDDFDLIRFDSVPTWEEVSRYRQDAHEILESSQPHLAQRG